MGGKTLLILFLHRFLHFITFLIDFKRFHSVWKSGRPVVTNRHSFSSEAKEILIPKYIPRGPTDILEVF
jgi:hypothetical protein